MEYKIKPQNEIVTGTKKPSGLAKKLMAGVLGTALISGCGGNMDRDYTKNLEFPTTNNYDAPVTIIYIDPLI